MAWTKGTLDREIRWRKTGEAEWHSIQVPLIDRPQVWDSESDGVRSARHGPSQPAYTITYLDTRLDITMSHEQQDFFTVEELRKFLSWRWYSNPDTTFLTPEGVLLAADLPLELAEHNSLNIELLRLTLNGEPIDKEVLKPFVHGRVSFE